MWDVYAFAVPVALGGTEQKIAEMITKSEMTRSYWGDEHFFVRHQRMDDDLAIHEEWRPYTPKFGEESDLNQNDTGSDCPFAELLQYL